ncbi:hypothetical protein [Streptomyces sp. NPDC050560]|uniref:hypothetical protein n=1 Tax=Streptomyces sp. NPDC050560 TaxID=3365630 RepID=UPI00379C89CD
MEPREFWDRNSVLAEAFCASDERVRHAQAVLDEAQAERSRTLAAFAVTVGHDGTIADLMGLTEREVRVARRTVGRGDARIVAEELLTRGPQGPEPQLTAEAAQPAPPLVAVQGPQGQPGAAAGAQQGPSPAAQQAPVAPAVSAAPAAHTAPAAVSAAPTPASAFSSFSYPLTAVPASSVQDLMGEQLGFHVPHPREEMPAPPEVPPDVPAAAPEPPASVVWSPSMDSVLLWSWRSNLDLQTVAAELGVDLGSLLQRVQSLAGEGLLSPAPPVEPVRSGRHRRHPYEAGYATLVDAAVPFAV